MINYQKLIPFTKEDMDLPKDKTVTNTKIIECMREEFLKYGYEKASLNRISAKVGITTAGLYKHFKNKEDMFYYLVKDTLADFQNMNAKGQKEMKDDPFYDPFAPEYIDTLIEVIYKHYEGFKLLICCSEGSAYESFEEDLIHMEEETNKEYAAILKKKTGKGKSINDMEWHLLSTAYIHLVSEIVRHDMSKDEAAEHMRFVSKLLYPGWRELLGLNE